jgi:hypothetical protein
MRAKIPTRARLACAEDKEENAPARSRPKLMNSHRSFSFASLLLCVGLIAGCAASSHQRVPLPAQNVVVTRPDLTRIYFVREDPNVLHKGGVNVLDGDMEIGTLTNGTFLCWERAGGRTLGRAFYGGVDPSKGSVDGVVDLDCAAGRAYYFKVVVDREGGKPVITAVDVPDGQKLVAERRPANKD